MLPAHIAENIKKQVLFYLQSTFAFRDRKVEEAFNRFLKDPDTGLFKGPWIQLRRPFRPAPADCTFPLEIEIPFHPFLHQYLSWLRLASREQQPQSTIVTTGTGSGKTECFLYPLLDHCLRARKQGQKGIKAIVLYPMNALAADQEKRFAQAVLTDPLLKEAQIRVGNYTGRYDPSDPGAAKDSGFKKMGKKGGTWHGITNHEVQLIDPPDILLTNYRMLDFLLMRPQDQRLWRFNEPDDVLKYLVLDELHTYDGAQGADVACLIRRLKERLSIPKGTLCVVGTSATLDDQEDSLAAGSLDEAAGVDAIETGSDRLARFAGTLFEENITAESVIGEDRLTVEEIVNQHLEELTLPDPAVCQPVEGEDALGYAKRLAGEWGGPVAKSSSDKLEQKAFDEAWLLELGHWLKKKSLFKSLLETFQEAEEKKQDPLSWNTLVEQVCRKDLSFSDSPKGEDRHLLLTSFIALVGHAKEKRSGKDFPLVPSQVQLWVRELRRLGRVVSAVPLFSWLDETVESTRSLPAFHCSECGESGWIGLHMPDGDTAIQAAGVQGIQLNDEPADIYRGWFGYQGQKSQYITIISPWSEQDSLAEAQMPRQIDIEDNRDFLCPASLILRKGDGPCPITESTQRFRVKVDRKTKKNSNRDTIGDQGCPRCGSKNGVFFIGSQAATLSSVAIDEMFGSVLNNDPKLLAFTDSVQDASHRAGFFTARTYHFTYRTALQHVIDAAGKTGLPLQDTGNRLLEYWSQDKPGFPGPGKAIEALLPPDLQQYPLYLDYRGSSSTVLPPKLKKEVESRLCWQATSEFGIMQTHGRSLEFSGSSCLGWDEERISETIHSLREKLPAVDSLFEAVADDNFRLWIYGILYRYRERGSVSHPYLVSLAKLNYWGKYPFGRTIEGREAYPPRGRFQPKLIVTKRQSGHEYILAPSSSSMSPWHIIWSCRALGGPVVPESSIIDLLKVFLEAGAASRLLKKIHQDGVKEFFTIAAEAARLYSSGVYLSCDESGQKIFRPEYEAGLWQDAPSMDYFTKKGKYRGEPFSQRQLYYQTRYRKGALRRVVAHEHTGLLATEERETLERDFAEMKHADDPNILTCTSTLEMGIDIGDLSSTLLCSIPPNTASYLQRIGRAGRSTGTALIVSFINQQPHDLFFYARPAEMLKGKVEPPGCWLDASAVLVRQYLGYCFDSASHEGILPELPKSGKQLVDDMASSTGLILGMMTWVANNETALRSRFLRRFNDEVVLPDTRERFFSETETELLLQRIYKAVNDFNRLQKDLKNAKDRLNTQLKGLGSNEQEARKEIETELKILSGRSRSLSRTGALEIFTDHGLLPNYAFPERGVRFYGAIYNKHHDGKQQEHKPIELSRPAGTALRELAPASVFYTHSRQFTIQQLAIGNSQQPIVESWGICGKCGHMRMVDDLHRPDASPNCPQCGHGAEDNESQLDQGQQKKFLEFSQSQALSFMEHYESLSGDKNEERQREFYQLVTCFDHTIEAPVGAVGNDDLPFGIEYLASMIRRDVNVGYLGNGGGVLFGPDQEAPEDGFWVCADCGIVVPPNKKKEETAKLHRRSCRGRRRYEKLRQEGRTGDGFIWESLYLYRQLRSEAIRLLLPLIDSEDINTLIACLYLGLRLRFEGNPAHLIIAPQVLPDPATGLEKHYLVLMDAVPGGTGYLKTLFQEKESVTGLEGEGIMNVMRLACDALESCQCRKLPLQYGVDDTDGCYRCLRSYHLQYKADQISRDRGIVLLRELIEAGEKRLQKKSLESIKPDSLFGSVLEKKVIDSLQSFVTAESGKWETTIIKGGKGFRFVLPGSERIWEVELQPLLGLAQGVAVACQPDFMLSCDDDDIKPVAIFADGFEFHCHPHNRIADDMNKRRAIIESRKYHVWNITWEDLVTDTPGHVMVCPQPVAKTLLAASRAQGVVVPDALMVVRNGIEQLKAYLQKPVASGWKMLADLAIFWPLGVWYGKRNVMFTQLSTAIEDWRGGAGIPPVSHVEEGDWVYNDKMSLNQDVLSFIAVADVLSNRRSATVTLARLSDSGTEVTGSDFQERWRRFLACLNLYQFSSNFRFWAASEVESGDAPDIPAAEADLPESWQEVLDETASSVHPYISVLAAADIDLPEIEYFNTYIDDDAFAEMAWPKCHPPVAVLAGDQEDFAEKWQQLGWKVVVVDDLQVKGGNWLADIVKKNAKGE